MITIPRTGAPAIEFLGELVAGGSTRTADGACHNRWHEIQVYRTEAGRYVGATRYRTEWAGEVGFDDGFPSPPIDENPPATIVEWLRDCDPCDHVAGFPPSRADKQERLLAELRLRYDHLVSEIAEKLGVRELVA